jgi:Protein of unknown function (DUF3102)
LRDVERSPLGELAAGINTEHRACQAAITSALTHALRAGALLVRAKQRLPHGSWGAWLAYNFQGSDRTARAYMMVSKRRAELEAKRQSSADMSLDEALRVLRPPREEAPHQAERENQAPEEAQGDPEETVDGQITVDEAIEAEKATAAGEALAEKVREDKDPPAPRTVGEALDQAAEEGEVVDLPPKELSESQKQGYKNVERWYALKKYDPEEVAKAHDRAADPERWRAELGRVREMMVWLERYEDALLAMSADSRS